jgi:short-subunit dehydrogenase
MAAELADEVALITGAGRGIGRATALRLAQAGCALALVSRTRADLEAVASEVTALRVPTCVLPADIADSGQVESLVPLAMQRLGPISILINNACAAPARTPLAKPAPADADRTLATCLRAPIILSRLLLQDMLVRQHGAIINIASTAARTPRAGEAVYAASKAGLLAFSHALFAEVRDSGIRVAAVCPGYVDTSLVPRNRRVDRTKFLRPGDVAEAIFHILTRPPGACSTELLLEPQFTPERA